MAERIATYRLQLTPAFGFAAAAQVVGYVADLGISHLYCSPILQAARGSRHGYDVVDPTCVWAELGGEAGLHALSEAARQRGLSLLLDIVPNHMSVVDRRNRWWWDVLTAGRASPYASYFDINWEHPVLRGRVMAPILEESLEETLEAGLLRLVIDAGVVIAHREARLPLSGPTLCDVTASTPLLELAERIRDAEFAEDRGHFSAELAERLEGEAGVRAEVERRIEQWNRDPERMRQLLDEQHYALTHWREATAVMNYRSFFDITSLVGVRVEDPEVLAATHALVDALLDQGVAEGVRIDHVDGLRLPQQYLERMRRRHPERWIVVEKILGEDERLPDPWPVDGTTGYDFAALADGLFVDRAGWQRLRAGWVEATGHPGDFMEVVRHSKREVMDSVLQPNLDRLLRMLASLAREHGLDSLAERPDRLRSALTGYLVELDVYRTYIDADQGEPGAADRERIVRALERAAGGGADGEALALLRSAVLESAPGTVGRDLALRLQQTSTVVAAKGVEDTAFYRFPVLSAACEVGGFPADPAVSAATFHAANQERQHRWPRSLLATSTHDSKRGEDVRARLAILSELPDAWMEMTGRWRRRGLGQRSAEVPGRTMQELLYQTAVGAWPIGGERLIAYMLKAASEAKQRTSWVDPDDRYRSALGEVVDSLLGDSTFRSDVEDFVARLREPAAVNSLALTLLRMTSPGIPDTYQGTELAELTLVDPDNRRPVDFALRRRLLAALEREGPPASWNPGVPEDAKLRVIAAALRLRRRRPELFDERGGYRPLEAQGPRAEHVVAFARGAEPAAITVVPRLVLRLGGRWDGTRLDLPPGRWVDVVGGREHSGPAPLADLLGGLPVALLERR
jgi:(1->4)-alpha-D-glucan 1-alpha-D-glucosylmutase